MKPNRMKQLLAEGKVPVGHMVIEFGTRGIARILETTGVDFVIVDMEQTGFTAANIADLMAWFKATAVTPFVRVPQIEYHFIARTLDAGALGIMVPNVESGAEARAVVEAAKYAPLGKRGVAMGGANTDFKGVDPEEFLSYANENTSIICQIESQAGLDHLEEIAATPGVDVLWLGHFDLSHSMGIAAQFEHPRFLDALKRIADTAKKHGLAAGMGPRSLTQVQEWLEIGFNVVTYGNDVGVYKNGLTEGVAGVRKLAGG
jgi:2-dehydro-3-deoxyglucarate aldolase/4-hydroxy-2-oxoheptanedioate aldolase